MKKIMVLFIVMTYTLMGCSDSIETEQLGIVTLMGVGLDENKDITVVIQEKLLENQVTGTGGGGSTTPFLLYKGSGRTISEALQKMATDAHHRFYFSHIKIIILDEVLLRTNGIKDILDFYERNQEVRLSTWLLISPKGKLEKIISTDLGYNTDTGTILEEIITLEKNNSFYNYNNISTVTEILNTSGRELFASGINTVCKHLECKSSDKNGANEKFDLRDTAVFKDTKMIGWLSTEERRGLSLITGTVKGGEMTIPIKNKALSLRVTKIKSKIEPEIEKGKVHININVDLTSRILESQTKLDFTDENTIKMIEQIQIKEIKKDITAILKKSRELKSDFLGFGNYVNMRYPLFWRKMKNEWYSYYPDIKVNINVHSKIENTGKVHNA